MRIRNLLGLTGACLLVVALFVFTRVQGAFFAWFLFYFTTLLLVYEVAVWLVGVKGVRTERDLSAVRLSAGQSLKLSVTLHRDGWWPLLWVRIRDDLPERWVFQTLGAERVLQPMWATRTNFTYEISGLQRGVHRIGNTIVETGDLFGLVRRRKQVQRSDEVLVYPHVMPVRGWSGDRPEEQGFRQPTRRRAEESTNVLGVRDYVPGDRLSRIHWPASAKRGQLQAKEFELHVTSELLFIVDVARASFESRTLGLFELEMTVAASLIKHAFDLHRQFAFTMHGEQLVSLPAGRDAALFFHCMEELAMAAPNGRTSFAQSLRRLAQEAAPGTTLVLVSPTVDRETAAAVGAVRHRAPIEWFMPLSGPEVGTADREGLEMLTAAGVRTHLIQTPDDLLSLQRGGLHRATGI